MKKKSKSNFNINKFYIIFFLLDKIYLTND